MVRSHQNFIKDVICRIHICLVKTLVVVAEVLVSLSEIQRDKVDQGKLINVLIIVIFRCSFQA